jgi:hypothetical protein
MTASADYSLYTFQSRYFLDQRQSFVDDILNLEVATKTKDEKYISYYFFQQTKKYTKLVPRRGIFCHYLYSISYAILVRQCRKECSSKPRQSLERS